MPEERPMARFQVEERLAQLLSHLGLNQAHFVARLDTDWTGLVVHHPELITSLTLICPGSMDATALHPLGSRLLVVNDDQPTGAQVTQAMEQLPDATLVTLADYAGYGWADIAADRPNEIDSALLAFVSQIEEGQSADRAATLPQGTGEFADITYHVRRSGPPLVLLPLRLAPSQWDPLLPVLSARYCTITLSGASVGTIAMLEARRHSDYLRLVHTVLDTTPLHPGERVLEVGCGSGSLSRWLAQHTGGANPIIGTDISRYMVQEAEALATTEEVNEVVEFREGNAEALPFADNRFHNFPHYVVHHIVGGMKKT